MIRILHVNHAAAETREYPLDRLPELLKTSTGLTWVDLAEEQPGQTDPILRDVFGFHPLAIQDALHETHAAKLAKWDDYIYLVLHGPLTETDLAIPGQPPELDLFFGKRFLVTHHHVDLPAVEAVWQMCLQDQHLMSAGADHLVFRLAQELLREHFRMLDSLEEQINILESRIFTGPDPKIPEELFACKRVLLRERSSVTPMRDAFSQLALENLPVVDSRDRIFFRDIYEQVNRLEGLVTHLRDLVTSTLDTYLTVVNNRMNDTMRLMAAITVLFLPITFITGFFGMNFFMAQQPTEFWAGNGMLWIAVAGMLLIPVVILTWMKHRGLI